MREPVIYLHRIADGVYFIYKLSNYDGYPVKLIAAGIAFDKGGDYSPKFKRLMKNYGLEKYMINTTHTTSDTYKIFLDRIYLDHKVGGNKIPIPKKALYIAEYTYHREKEIKEEKLMTDIDLAVIKGKIFEKLKELKDKLQ